VHYELQKYFFLENLANFVLVKFTKYEYTIEIVVFFQNFPKFSNFESILLNQNTERYLDYRFA
jgi:hypothetical protein